MATGFCPALLTNIEAVAESNAPSRKLHIAGFLAALFCCQNSAVNPINQTNDGAHTRPLTVKYRVRPTLTSVQYEDDCDINRIPAYLEWNVGTPTHVQSSFFLDEATLQQYCRDASNMRTAGSTSVTDEVYGLILEHANILMKAINRVTVTQMATQFGTNIQTGSALGKVINITKTADQYVLDNGIQQIWGQNSVAVLAPGSVKFIGRNKYQGAFAGQKGTSFFMTMPLPVNEFGCNLDDCLRELVFDVQLKYIDCPTSVTVNGAAQTVNRGWEVIISKEFALWVQPTNAYAASDELYGTNGTLKYFFENASYTSGSYASSKALGAYAYAGI